MRRFVAKVTGLSRAQSTRLIGQYQRTGHIRDRRYGATRPFERRYTAADIRLLAEVDETLGGLCGPTTRRVMRRQYEVFGDERFERLAGLSNSHLSRMRQSTTYRRRRNPTTKTRATQVNIGERRKPHPQGRAARSIGTTRFCGKFSQPGSTRETPRRWRRTPPPGRAPAGRRRCGLGRASSGAKRGERRQHHPVGPGVAVADTDNHHERARRAGSVRLPIGATSIEV